MTPPEQKGLWSRHEGLIDNIDNIIIDINDLNLIDLIGNIVIIVSDDWLDCYCFSFLD